MNTQVLVGLLACAALAGCDGAEALCDDQKFDCTPKCDTQKFDCTPLGSSQISISSDASISSTAAASSVDNIDPYTANSSSESASKVSSEANSSASLPSTPLSIASECFIEFSPGDSTYAQWNSNCTSYSREAYDDPYSPEPIAFYSRYVEFTLDSIEDLGFSAFGGNSTYLYLLDAVTGDVLKSDYRELDVSAIEAGHYVLEISGANVTSFTLDSTKIDFGTPECYLPLTVNQSVATSWRPECTSNIRDYIDPYQESNAIAHRARFFNFEIEDNGDVEIQVDSAAQYYMYLYSGTNDATIPLYSGSNDKAVSLEPGSYTLEVATYSKDDVGEFNVRVEQLDSNQQCEQAAIFNSTLAGGWIGNCLKKSTFTNNDPYAPSNDSYARYYAIDLDSPSDMQLSLKTESFGAKALAIYNKGDLHTPIKFNSSDFLRTLNIDIRLEAGEYIIETLSNDLKQYQIRIDQLDSTTSCEQSIELNVPYQGLSDSGCPMALPVTDNIDPYALNPNGYVSNRFNFSLMEPQALSVSTRGDLSSNPFALYRSLPGSEPLIIAARPTDYFSSPSTVKAALGKGDYFVDIWVDNNSAPRNFELNVNTTNNSECESFLPLSKNISTQLFRFCNSIQKPRDTSNDDPYTFNNTGYFYSQRFTFAVLEEGEYQLDINGSFRPEVYYWPSNKNEDVTRVTGSQILMDLTTGYYTIEVTSESSDVLGSFTIKATKP
ncbi:hypothetical protein [Marinagarivorans algicola]|uniref:hypothetical protein n=1 Tax=Marinagarivorans algicola TaxID=1513270 RepID=UPI0037354C8F